MYKYIVKSVVKNQRESKGGGGQVFVALKSDYIEEGDKYAKTVSDVLKKFGGR